MSQITSSKPTSVLVNNMNLDEIEAVRLKMIQLFEAQTLFGNSVSPEQISDWPELLSRFNVQGSKHTNLSTALNDQKLRKIVLHPKEVLNDEADSRLLNLLRTMQTPEIKAAETEIKDQIAIDEGLKEQEEDALKSHEDKEENDGKWEALWNEWKKIYDEHEAVCTRASTFVDDIFSKEVPPGVQRLPEPEQEGGVVDASGKQEELSLEDVLSFMSSGTKNGKVPVVGRP